MTAALHVARMLKAHISLQKSDTRNSFNAVRSSAKFIDQKAAWQPRLGA